jgi:hypothetical protein
VGLIAAAHKEIAELHAFFESWLGGDCANDDGTYGRFESALETEFTLTGPDGQSTPAAELLALLRVAHGSRPGLKLWTRDVQARPLGATHVLVTYEEWQRQQAGERGRRSSAVLVEAAQAPGGLRWCHVHETWLAEQARSLPGEG